MSADNKPRMKPPARCPSETLKISTKSGQRIHLTFQFHERFPERPHGVFYAGGFRSGSDMEFTMHDACILISLLLQHGYEARDILTKLSRSPQQSDQSAQGSMIGVIVQGLADRTKDDEA